MYCPHCGNAIKDSARYCNKCGTPVADGNRTRTIPVNKEAKVPRPSHDSPARAAASASSDPASANPSMGSGRTDGRPTQSSGTGTEGHDGKSGGAFDGLFVEPCLPATDLDLRPYEFLIWGMLYSLSIYDLVRCVNYVTPPTTGEYVAIGLVLLALGVFALYVRCRLATFKTDAPALLGIYLKAEVAFACFQVVRMFSMHYIGYSIIGPFLRALVYTIVAYKVDAYIKRLAGFFVNA